MIDMSRFSQDAEQAVLGGLLKEAAAFDKISSLVAAEDFYAEAHRLIFGSINFLLADNKPVDILTVDADLERRGSAKRVGGIAYLASLVQAVPGTANITRYAELVRNKAIERQLMAAGSSVLEIVSGTGTVQQKVDQAQAAIMAVADRGAEQRGPVSIADMALRAIEEIDRRINSDCPLVGTSTGFADLDGLTSGLKAGELVVIAGRPAMGKSTLAVNIGEHVALGGNGVLLVSTEMSEAQISQKHMASLGGIELEKITSGRGLNDDDYNGLTVAAGKAQNMTLSLDESARTIAQIATSARKVKRQTGLKLLIVDYLQQLDANAENRTQAIGEISRGLKELAKSMGICVIALSQLSRKVEERADKRPMMSDLRESGSIEQDADMVVFVYRDEYYNPDSPMKGLAEVIIAKNRMGKTGTAMLATQLERSRFVNADQRSSWEAREQTQQPKSRRRSTFDS